MDWNKMFQRHLNNCVEVGRKSCLLVYYEQLVIHPEKTMRKILTFLGISWNPMVLHHEQLVGKKIRLSRVRYICYSNKK